LTDLNTNISGSFISAHSLSFFPPAELVVFGLTANIHISPTANADIDKVGGEEASVTLSFTATRKEVLSA